MTEKRRVTVYKYQYEKGQPVKKCLGNGVFQQYGTDYEEYESGPGNFTTAIVEMDDGSVKNVAVDLITFIKHK